MIVSNTSALIPAAPTIDVTEARWASAEVAALIERLGPDSPVAMAAYHYDKIAEWSDSGGVPETIFSYDEILDAISLYWLTNTGASSSRPKMGRAVSAVASRASDSTRRLERLMSLTRDRPLQVRPL